MPDHGIVPRLDTPSEGSATATDAQGVGRPRHALAATHKDPTWEDMLIAYATVPGYVANRNLFRGTWFIESICQVFMNMAHDTDIREMLDEVSDQMRYYESEYGTKQSCSYEVGRPVHIFKWTSFSFAFRFKVRHFYKKLFFNPGIVINMEQQQQSGLSDKV